MGRRFWRQGDLVFRKLDENEAASIGGVPIMTEVRIGSETGHPHTIRAKSIQVWGSTNETGLVTALDHAFVESERPVEVQHDQHATLLLPEGRYIVRTVGLGRRRMFD